MKLKGSPKQLLCVHDFSICSCQTVVRIFRGPPICIHRCCSMNHSLTVLTCGRNATGLSAMFTVQREHYIASESIVLSRCLINVGDTTQRFCGENRIKLFPVRCVIITSLAPHNVSGLPGILLCLSALVILCPQLLPFVWMQDFIQTFL